MGNVVEAIRAELDGNDDTAIWFALLAESGPDAIEAQGWQLQAELKDRGVKAELRDVQDAMLELAHELLGLEDPRLEMMRITTRWISRRSTEDQERYRVIFEEGFPEFWEAPAADFRQFLRRCCVGAMETEREVG